MSFKSLGNPFDGSSDLTHGPGCACPICVFTREQAQSNYECSETELTEKLERAVFEGSDQSLPETAMQASSADTAPATDSNSLDTS